jgi:hypothetical protein
VSVRQKIQPLTSGARKPVVSVVVPCYKYGHFLPACIGSILDQPGVDVDILIIDDASPDDSGTVALALAEQHEQVRTIVHETNKGHIATYNEGLPTMQGDYLVLLSADDLLTPGSLGRATALMESNPSVGMVYGNPLTFDEVVPTARATAKSWSVWTGPQWIEKQFARGMSIVYSPEAVVRTSVHRQVGYYDPALPHSGDLEMWLRIAAVAGIGRINGADQAMRREHAASMMHTTYGTVLIDLKTRDEAYEAFLAGTGRELPNKDQLRATARRGMADEALDWVCLLLTRSGAGTHEPEVAQEVSECVAFAMHISPVYSSLRAWREYELLSSGDTGLKASIERRAHALRRDVKGRVKWQRWYRMGI